MNEKSSIKLTFEVTDGIAKGAITKDGKKILELNGDLPEALKAITALTPTKLDDKIAPFIDLLKSQIDFGKIEKEL